MYKYDNSSVRRQDRLLSENIAKDLLCNGEFCFMAMVEKIHNNCGGYGIPISYVWDNEDYIYFHCAPDGHKLNCLDANPNVTLCIVGKTNVIPDKFTTAYQSILIRGTAQRNLDEQERFHALKLLLEKYSTHHVETGLKYAKASFHRTEIIRVKINNISGKEKKMLNF